ncbi:HPr family phosphocarrier protein [Parasphingopyxis lamellibrachiae]|uniref:Phosphocarrier protein n=1 Tax=Parasphingopyxis lamellibrachiae TaxID=680125 RepID=A0A3D9FEZ8_9SPHN|nr:HPr family phosphocarrier protein [Parasphingopyxis lamellibrachiae]RED15651.1 phosphocarrier protein [Parasphingopyxis lamellibrachiae]
MSGVERTVTIANQRGLHARASSKFVTLVSELGVEIKVSRDDQWVAGSSILDLMMLGAAMGDDITIRADGDGAEDAVSKLAELVESKFGED